MAIRTFTSSFIIILITANAYAQKVELDISDPVMIDESYSLYLAGDFFLAGQPTQKNLDSLIQSGVTHVVNLRTADEMTYLNYDEAEYLQKKGIHYIHIPMGGDDGYKPEAIEQMGDFLMSADNKVLIHCRGAGRATYAWMAWMIRFQNYSIDQAVQLGSKARFSVPFFDLLGFPITIQKKL